MFNHRKPIFFIIITALFFILNMLTGLAAPAVVKEAESLIAGNAATWWDDRYGDTYLNCTSYTQDALVTFRGWQYAVYYNTNRYVTVSRRQLPDGAWQHLTLTDYQQTTNDNHNNISLGISPNDGRIHLSFDHHSSTLHYRQSQAGVATNPGSYTWQASLFGSVRNNLGGAQITLFTYPRFITAPNGAFLLEGRIGTSGDGDNQLWRYNDNGGWTDLGKFLEGAGENAYFHGFCYDKNNRLHAAWCWRATSDGNTNHDLLYGYSDDHGITWKNNAGSSLATAGSNPIDPSKNFKVWTIAQGSRLINQEGMIIDAQNRVHVISRENVSTTNYQMHYWRDTNGTWQRVNTGIATKIWDNRSKIAYDRDGNVYGILPNLQIASASVAAGYSDWTVQDKTMDGRFHHAEPLIDPFALLAGNNELYVFVQAGTTSTTSPDIYVLKYRLDANNPTGILGDVNNSGQVDINDALLIARFAAGFNPAVFVQANADVNRDGKIDVVDALLIARYAAGLISGF